MATGRERSNAESLTLDVDGRARVSALWMLPPDAHTVYVLAHGAGAGMTHAFMSAIANELATVGVGTLRYQFPYVESRVKRPDPPAVCHATVRAAATEAARRAPGLRLIAGGKSFGGRMTSQAQAISPLAGVRGLAFLGFPLHPPKKPGTDRAKHLFEVKIPMLFLQGTRDELADPALLEPIVRGLGERALLRKIDGADHSFHVLARSGRNDADVLRELANELAEWAISL
ncbi:MAG TPA: alpha/beta family hydrolase [Steroidobacteraceae bacterium]|jgi:predicted alpha/beta-hydrolase family hydrolase|nr:alpha/beta family hydrolase [Steroidobacteraceae bacterium]